MAPTLPCPDWSDQGTSVNRNASEGRGWDWLYEFVLCRHKFACTNKHAWLPPSLSACAAGQELWPLIVAFFPFIFSCWSFLPRYHTMSNSVPTCRTSSCPTPPHCHISCWKHLFPSSCCSQARAQNGQSDKGKETEHCELWQRPCRRCLARASHVRAQVWIALVYAHMQIWMFSMA